MIYKYEHLCYLKGFQKRKFMLFERFSKYEHLCYLKIFKYEHLRYLNNFQKEQLRCLNDLLLNKF